MKTLPTTLLQIFCKINLNCKDIVKSIIVPEDKKTRKITETLANGYSSESTRRELSNEYQDKRVSMFFQESCILVLTTKVVSAV